MNDVLTTILITGASGFIGSNLIAEFNSDAIKLYMLCRPSSELRVNTNINYTRIICDGIENLDVSTCPSNIDVVVHLAGLAHIHSHESKYGEHLELSSNISKKIAELVEYASVKHLIFLSSAKVYGETTDKEIKTELSGTNPLSLYAQAKFNAENIFHTLAGENLRVSIIRPPLVYGAGAKANVNALLNLSSVLPLNPFRFFNNKRSMIGVHNLVDFIKVLIFENPRIPYQFEVFNVSDKTDYSTNDFYQLLLDAQAKKSASIPIPLWCYQCIFRLLGRQDFFLKLSSNFQIDSLMPKRFYSWEPKISPKKEITLMLKRP